MWGFAALSVSYGFSCFVIQLVGIQKSNLTSSVCLFFFQFIEKIIDRLTNNGNNQHSTVHPWSTHSLWISTLCHFLYDVEMCSCSVTCGYLWWLSFSSLSILHLFVIKSMNTLLPLRNVRYFFSESCMQIASMAPKGLSASVFKIYLERKTFYGITLSWKLLSCHSQAVRPCTQGFARFSKRWQPLPLGI